MKKRLPYLIAFTLLLGIEILIGHFAHDDFIRPYVGDILVTVLLCCLARCILLDGCPWLPTAVFCLAVFVECVQLIDIPVLDGTLWGIILGSTFDLADVFCYALGCASFSIAEHLLQ